MVRIYKSAAWALAAWLGVSQPAFAEERILDFDSTITVQHDGTLEVHEAIRVNAEGNHIRRGIFRDFPTTYPGKDGGQIVVGFAFESATRDGNSEPWHSENIGNGVRIYLGSASLMLPPGEHTYELVYRTDRQMGFFADHDELYWNATGNGWGFPIDHATARVMLPAAIPRGDLKLEAYTGPQGARGAAYSATLQNDTPLFTTTQPLGPGEGLTIVAMWPKGFISPAVENALPAAVTESPGYDYERDAGRSRNYNSPAEAFLHKDLPRDNRPVFFGLLGLALVLGYYYYIWNRVGRDPPGRVIIPEYEMPAKQSAASMRYLMRMGYDNECFAAAILALATKGYLRIKQDNGVLGVGKSTTLIKDSSEGARSMSDDEQQVLASIFEDGDTLELVPENHATVSGARAAHRGAIKQRYTAGFFSINGGWHFLGILLSLLVGAITLSLPGAADFWPQWYFTSTVGWVTVLAVVGGLVANGVFGRLLKAPTVAGQAAMDHVRGFKMYLEVAEGEELKRVTAPPPKMTPQLYESYLPAALALDVEQRWAEKFARQLAIDPQNYHPAWYVGSAWNSASIVGFSSQLGTSLSSAISSASTAPGSSSGGGGGGSSGGGGGGGGGGGW